MISKHRQPFASDFLLPGGEGQDQGAPPIGICQHVQFAAAFVTAAIFCLLLTGCARPKATSAPPAPASTAGTPLPNTLDLRQPMELAACAIPPRLDPAMDFRPWFLLRGTNNIPTTPEHSMWDVGDMAGRYLESLILSRRMGISSPELSEAEARLQKFLWKSLGADGLIHDPQSSDIDSSFSQGSALYGLLAWFEDTGDPQVRQAIERLITALLQRSERDGDKLVDAAAKVPGHSGCHLSSYQVFPIIRFYELTGYPDALKLAEGRTHWVMADPVLAENGEIKSTDSWAGHLHSWLDALAGCVRTARNSKSLDQQEIIARCKAGYDWIRRSNMTSFGWVATFPTHGSSETCAISSVIRLALELSACGYTEYLDDVERFVRNQVVEAQFRNPDAYRNGTNRATPLLIGCFDSQSLPNGHLGTRGGEDVGNVEGCCLNGGMRAIALAWEAIACGDEHGITVQLALNRNTPAGQVIDYQPFEGRVDVIPRAPGSVRVHVPDWAKRESISVLVNEQPAQWKSEKNFVLLDSVDGRSRVSVRFPLRELRESISVAGNTYQVSWRGNVVVGMNPPGQREPTYQNRLGAARRSGLEEMGIPDTYVLQDAARLASCAMLARMDLERGGQPFFRTYPFANPPRAEHEKWDDGDMSGRYVEALILARRMTGLLIDSRESILRKYFAGLFDGSDGLCYNQGASWNPRRACLFSQSSAMLGLLAWYRETGLPEIRKLLDRQVDGVMRIAVDRGDNAYYPKYEFDGTNYVDDPPGKDAPIWYGARLIVPLVEYWQLSGRADVKTFLDKLVRHCTEVSTFIKPDGAVEQGEGWWGHLHSTMDMAAGIADYGRLTGRPELVAWSKRIYDWIGRTHTTRYGWVADVSGGNVCESCAIASRIRLGLALHRAGVVDAFDEIDRFVRNQLLHNQFCDLSFLPPGKPETPRTAQCVYDGVDRMVRGTFQCWGTANDLIGHDDVEGCGAGGGVQGIAMAWASQSEWRDLPNGRELKIHLLFNRRIRAKAEPPFTKSSPIAAQLWSYLPQEGRVTLTAHQDIERVAIQLPTGADVSSVRLERRNIGSIKSEVVGEGQRDGQYVLVPHVQRGETIDLRFALKQFETVERAAGKEYRVKWKGNAVVSIDPPGDKASLYRDGAKVLETSTPICWPRYP